MKKRIPSFLLTLIIALTLVVACSDNEAQVEPSASTSPTEPTPEVAVAETPESEAPAADGIARGVFITLDLSSASQMWKVDELRRLMGDYDVDMTWFSGDANDNISSIEQAIADGCDVIFINHFGIEGLIPELTRAREAGVIVGLFGSQPPLDEHPDYPFDFFVGSDEYFGGVQAGEFVSEQFPDGATFVEVGGQAGHIAAIERHEGFHDGINANIIELASQFVPGPWRSDEARTIMEEFLVQFDNIDIVFCHWDNGATGVIEAVEAAGRLDEIYIIGFDGNNVGFQQVKDGVQSLSVGYSFTNTVIKLLELARIKLDGGTVDKINWIPYNMVTLETIDTFTWPEW